MTTSGMKAEVPTVNDVMNFMKRDNAALDRGTQMSYCIHHGRFHCSTFNNSPLLAITPQVRPSRVFQPFLSRDTFFTILSKS